MKKLIDANALLDSMGIAAREVLTEDITDADELANAMEVAMRECVYNAPIWEFIDE